VSDYIKKVLDNEESWDQFEKQDNIRWWPEMFVPLVSAAMLSLIEPNSEILDLHRNRWADFAEKAFSQGFYDKEGPICLTSYCRIHRETGKTGFLTVLSWF